MDPDSTEPEAGDGIETIRRIVDGYAGTPGGLLPMLHAVQRAVGCVPARAVPTIAEAVNMSRAEVHGVVSFYHFFREKPAGKQIIYVCRAEACQSMGSRQLEQHIREVLDLDWHETTADGRFSLEPVYCLGNCACAPTIMIDETVHGRVTHDRADELLK